MTAYQAFQVNEIAKEINAINDPVVLKVYLKTILIRMCNIGENAKNHTCIGCPFKGFPCRELSTALSYIEWDDEENEVDN